MEVWRTRSKSAKDRPFDLADVVENSIDQALSEVCGRFAIAGRQTCIGILLAYGDLR